MPGKIKVKVLAGRNLPVMDRASDTTDAFVEIKFGNVTHKTDVCRKTLNPHWSSTEWYRFEVDESELQDEPLQLRLMDHDTYSANDAIGKVVISLAPLLAMKANIAKSGGPPGGAVLSGWIPVFDTMHGIRGELNVIVKVELFSDFNKYKTSSCGVQFFHCPSIPPGYKAISILGFVEELVVNDDPEYQWIDKIRTPRASNEARQVAFIKLSNQVNLRDILILNDGKRFIQVQRLVGLKAAELGANAVLGYQQDFDLEGEAGVVARAIGTAVNLVAPPTLLQSINIPPCTQQQLKKYLDILATDNDSVMDLNQYFQSHQSELQRLLNIMNPKTTTLLDDPENADDDDKADFTRQSSIKSYTGWYQDDYVSQKSLKHISDDQTDLNRLLRRYEDSDSDSTGPLKKIKKLKTNFTKRLGSLRSRKSDKQDDNISLQSNSSDNSRISLVDIKNEFKKFKRMKKPKFRKTFTNNEDDGIGMASILARSVIHAHTSLACIAEKDSEHSPSSTMRRTSESEPTINISDEERKLSKNDENCTAQSEYRGKGIEVNTSLKNINLENTDNIITRQRKLSESCPASPMVERSENLLKLPEETGYFGSLSLSGDSSDVYTSSEEDDDSSDQNADGEKTVETTSSVVQSVLNKNVNPALIAHMDRKLSILEGVVPEIKESKSHSTFHDIRELETRRYSETSKSSPCIHENESNAVENVPTAEAMQSSNSSKNTKNDILLKSSNNHQFKFHNLFTNKKVSKSMSAPSSPIENKSFIYRSSKKIKRQISKISKTNLFKSLSHYSLSPKKNHKDTLSQPGSTSDVLSKIPSHENVLGSPFLSYADLMALDKESTDLQIKSLHCIDHIQKAKVTMYIGSEPVSRASLSGPSSPYYKNESLNHDLQNRIEKSNKPTLVHSAMETILLDKVQSLLLPASPEVNQSKEQQFFADVHEKLVKVEETRNKPQEYLYPLNKSENIGNKHLSLPATPCVFYGAENKFFDDQHISQRRSMSKGGKEKNQSLIHSAIKSILIDKVQSLAPATDEAMIIKEPNYGNEFIPQYESSHSKHHDKKRNLIHTAIENILIDKVQSLLPPSAEHVDTDDELIETSHHDAEFMTREKEESSSIFQSAMETMLLDRAQVMMPAVSVPVTPKSITPGRMSSNNTENNVCQIQEYSRKVNSDQNSLLHSAIETILIDKVQTLIPSDSNLISLKCPSEKFEVTAEDTQIKNKHQIVDDDNIVNCSLIHLAVETILIDKVRSLIPPSPKSLSLSDNQAQNPYQKRLEEVNNRKDTLYPPVKNVIIEGNQKNNENNIYKTHTPINLTEAKNIDKSQILHSSKTENPNEINKAYYTTPNKNNEAKIQSIHLNDKKLVRQDSIHSLPEDFESDKTSKETSANILVSSRIAHNKPVLQHFHPILCGKPLETIPSLPETSLDYNESLNIDEVPQTTCDCQSHSKRGECDSGTNSASVCDNSHAAWDVDRNERENEKSCEKEKGSPRHIRHESYGGQDPVAVPQATQSSSYTPSTPVGIHRRSSDSDLSVTPKGLSGGSLNASLGNSGSAGGAILRPSMNSSNIEMLEYPFLTMTEYPPGLILHLGGTVCARSVKLVDPGGESAARAAWWAELRTELRSHARALRCNAVIAYTENTAICEDVCVLSASGTAAVINLDCEFSSEVDAGTAFATEVSRADDPVDPEQCTVAHVPYSPGAGPIRAELSTCGGCKKSRVPAVLLATCAKPKRLHAYAKAVTVTAVAARIRRAPPASEPGARDISDQLPFLEYELHKLLLAKLKMQGANALFSLQTQITIGERCVMALASGTAVRLSALPPPTPPRIKASENDKNALDIQRALWDSFTLNKAINGYDIGGSVDTILPAVLLEPEGEEPPALDLCTDKDACVLELDEAEDVETAKTLATRRTHMPVFTSNSKPEIGAPPQLFAQVWRARLVGWSGGGGASLAAERHVTRALDGVTYKLRRLQPCALAAPRLQLELPEDEIQLVVSGSAIQLEDPDKPERNVPETGNSGNASPQLPSCRNSDHGNSGSDEDDIFTLDEEQIVKTPPPPVENDDKSLVINTGQAPTAVSLTTLGSVSGARAERRVCALRLLFVRETTAVRELGGLSGFLHTFTSEVLAIARANTAALGGNALTSFYIKQLMLQDNAHKNQKPKANDLHTIFPRARRRAAALRAGAAPARREPIA